MNLNQGFLILAVKIKRGIRLIHTKIGMLPTGVGKEK
jgi:hypothetical protein